MKNTFNIIISAIIVLIIFVIGCEKPANNNHVMTLEEGKLAFKPTGQKVVVLGIEALSWQIMRPLLANGSLPNIEKLMKSGVSGKLKSRRPMLSPAIWTTFATGVPREVHGIDDFVKGVKGEGPHLINSTNRKVKALWNILTEFGLKSYIVGYFDTYPVEKINGVILSERYKENPVLGGGETYLPANLVYPEKLYSELEKVSNITQQEVEQYAPEIYRILTSITTDLTSIDSHRQLVRLAQIMLDNLRKEIMRVKTSVYLFKTRKQPDLYMFYIPGVDGISHFFWDYYAHPRKDSQKEYSMLIPLYYEFADRLIGQLLAAVSSDSNVIVLSDHGFKGKGSRQITVFDYQKLATLLGYGKYNKKDSKFSISKDSTLFYSGNLYEIATFYLNPKYDKNPHRAELLKTIQKSFQLCKTGAGQPFFRKVNLYNKLGKNDYHLYKVPDIYCEVNVSFYQSKQMSLPDNTEIPLKDMFTKEFISFGTRDHELFGAIIASGPAFRKNAQEMKSYCSLFNVAPTILATLGIPLSKELYTGPCEALLDTKFLLKHTLIKIDSYGKREIKLQNLTPSNDELGKLKSLGYIN